MIFVRTPLRRLAPWRSSLLALVVAAVTAGNAAAQVDWLDEALTGDWRGLRSELSERGISLYVAQTADLMHNASGGVSRGTGFVGQFDLITEIDLGKLAGLSQTRVLLHAIASHGGRFDPRRVGSFMGTDNIEVEVNTAKLFQAWVERRMLEGRFSLLGGLYAVDSEFNVNEASDVFVHPAFGTSPELAQAGRNGPSIFPTTSLGLRMRYRPMRGAYVQAAVLDGVPGDPDNPRGTHVRFDRGDGAFWIVEAGFRPAVLEFELDPRRARRTPGAQTPAVRLREVSKFAVGAWGFTARFDDLVARDAAGRPQRSRSHGVYLLGEETLWRDPANPPRALAAFFTYGVAAGDANPLARSLVAGLRFRGVIPERPFDELGAGFARAYPGAKFVAAGSTAQIPVAAEVAVELTYRAQVTRWFSIQPTLQFIRHPGLSSSALDARIAGIRFEIAY